VDVFKRVEISVNQFKVTVTHNIGLDANSR